MKRPGFQVREILHIAGDVPIIAFSHYLSYLLAFGFHIPEPHRGLVTTTLPLIVASTVVIFLPFGLYTNLRRYSGVKCMESVVSAITVSCIFVFGIMAFFAPAHCKPLGSVFLINWFVLIILIGGVRFQTRIRRDLDGLLRKSLGKKGQNGRRLMIVGAGDAGEMILREVRQNPNLGYVPVCLIDDDPAKRGRAIHGTRVLGTRDDIPRVVAEKNIDDIVISIPSATGEQISAIVEQCRKTTARYKTVPSVAELIHGCVVDVKQIRNVRIEDTLGREPVRLDLEKAKSVFSGKSVLVTGAAGSIGSELARQLCRFRPKKIILYEREETNLFETHQDLLSLTPGIDIIPVVGDILDEAHLDDAMSRYQPYAVFHAAAYKHVPMMEMNPLEAVRNNIFGTLTVARRSMAHGVERFVLISTDKAVHPTSVMGVSKRAAEMAVLSLEENTTAVMVVRFGNVLASRGSVTSIFEKQIARGGPVTITHPEMTRYFMTIPEAVQLILLAASIGKPRDMFILDMGKPVKIMDLAEKMIRLSGLEPGRDIKIEITGLRAGEKLSEQLFADGEMAVPTEIERILKINYDPNRYDGELLSRIESLLALIERGDGTAIREQLSEITQEAPSRPDRIQQRKRTRATNQAARIISAG